MSEKRFTSFIEDDGYWIRDERDCKIIATGLKLGVASNLSTYLNELNDENIILKSELSFSQNQNRELRKVLKDNRSMAEVVERNKELEKENEKLQRRLSLYKMNEDEVDKYLRTHPMPTITNERTIIPLGIRHRCD